MQLKKHLAKILFIGFMSFVRFTSSNPIADEIPKNVQEKLEKFLKDGNVSKLLTLYPSKLDKNYFSTLFCGNFGNIKRLTIANYKNLVLLVEIGNVTKLENLFLVNDGLETLPSEIGNLRALKELYVGGNEGLISKYGLGFAKNCKVNDYGKLDEEFISKMLDMMRTRILKDNYLKFFIETVQYINNSTT